MNIQPQAKRSHPIDRALKYDGIVYVSMKDPKELVGITGNYDVRVGYSTSRHCSEPFQTDPDSFVLYCTQTAHVFALVKKHLQCKQFLIEKSGGWFKGNWFNIVNEIRLKIEQHIGTKGIYAEERTLEHTCNIIDVFPFYENDMGFSANGKKLQFKFSGDSFYFIHQGKLEVLKLDNIFFGIFKYKRENMKEILEEDLVYDLMDPNFVKLYGSSMKNQHVESVPIPIATLMNEYTNSPKRNIDIIREKLFVDGLIVWYKLFIPYVQIDDGDWIIETYGTNHPYDRHSTLCYDDNPALLYT